MRDLCQIPHTSSQKFFLVGAVRERPLQVGHKKLFLRTTIIGKYYHIYLKNFNVIAKFAENFMP